MTPIASFIGPTKTLHGQDFVLCRQLAVMCCFSKHVHFKEFFLDLLNTHVERDKKSSFSEVINYTDLHKICLHVSNYSIL